MFLLQSQLPPADQTGPRQHQIRQRTPPYSPTLHHDFKLMDKFSLSDKKVVKKERADITAGPLEGLGFM
jgi:hypothetical protein